MAQAGFLKQAHTRAAMLLPKDTQVSVSEMNPGLTTKSNLYNNISSCVIPELNPSSLHFKIEVNLKGRNRSASVAAMVNCGATALFISKRFVRRHGI